MNLHRTFLFHFVHQCGHQGSNQKSWGNFFEKAPFLRWRTHKRKRWILCALQRNWKLIDDICCNWQCTRHDNLWTDCINRQRAHTLSIILSLHCPDWHKLKSRLFEQISLAQQAFRCAHTVHCEFMMPWILQKHGAYPNARAWGPRFESWTDAHEAGGGLVTHTQKIEEWACLNGWKAAVNRSKRSKRARSAWATTHGDACTFKFKSIEWRMSHAQNARAIQWTNRTQKAAQMLQTDDLTRCENTAKLWGRMHCPDQCKLKSRLHKHISMA